MVYSFLNQTEDKALFLHVDGEYYSGNVDLVGISYTIPEHEDSVYPYETANALTAFIKNMSLGEAKAICEKAMQKGEYSDFPIDGIVLRYEKSESDLMEHWLIALAVSF